MQGRPPKWAPFFVLFWYPWGFPWGLKGRSRALRVTERQLRLVLGALIAVTVVLTVLNALHSVQPLRASWTWATTHDLPDGWATLIDASWTWATTHDLPYGWATLIGAVLGLSAIAWQTGRGFRHLIASQGNQAELDRKAMEVQAVFDRDAREHQAKLNLIADLEAQKAERLPLIAALQGELFACSRQLGNVRNWLILMEAMAEGIGKEGGKVKTPLGIPNSTTPIYDANIAKIGLLGASIACDVVEVYSMFSAKVVWDKPAELDPKLLCPILKEMSDLIPDQCDDILHVIRRLSAIAHGTDDPGLLRQHRADRNKESSLTAPSSLTRLV